MLTQNDTAQIEFALDEWWTCHYNRDYDKEPADCGLQPLWEEDLRNIKGRPFKPPVIVI